MLKKVITVKKKHFVFINEIKNNCLRNILHIEL
jgi:hypothetical protein